MYSGEDGRRPIRIASHTEDIPERLSGFLIPPHYPRRIKSTATSSEEVVAPVVHRSYQPFYVLTLSLLIAIVGLGSGIQVWLSGTSVSAAPIVYVTSAEVPEPVPLHYGVQPMLSHPNFFVETRARFLEEKLTFIEADLTKMRIVYYEEGVELFSAPILSKGKDGSWWETPAGLYDIELKKKDHFSSFGNVHQPWSMVFQGNFFIHGWPKYPNGEPVSEGYSGGCIRLGDEDAEALFKLVSVHTPVLVHEEDFENDAFVYEAKVPELSAEHYLLADIKSNAVLASSDLDAEAPIASVTKLMTALVAAEYINLDKDVTVSQEKYVNTLIPRLEGRWQVSMYSLLQLLLVESSNEAAEVIATQVGRERFIQLMNEKALALGLEHTTFTDPSGLDDGNVSTVSDLLRLAQYIHYNRSFIFELTYDQNLSTAYKSGQFGELENFNEIEDVDSFIGGKVGETSAAGQTSVSLHRLDINGEERVLALILLGSKSRRDDVLKLLEYTEEQFVR